MGYISSLPTLGQSIFVAEVLKRLNDTRIYKNKYLKLSKSLFLSALKKQNLRLNHSGALDAFEDRN